MTDFSFDVVASGLHPAEVVDAMVVPIRDALVRAGGAPDHARAGRPHTYLVATGGTEAALLERVNDRLIAEPAEPAILFAHGAHNSLPAALETLARLHQDGRRGRIVMVDGPHGDEDIAEVVADLVTVQRFRRCRLGAIGAASEWLVASTPSAEVVRRRWGPELVAVDMASVLRTAASVPVSLGSRVAGRFTQAAPAPLPPPADVAAAAHLHPVIAQVVEDRELDAVAVRCFDFLTELQTSGCLALAQFNDDGFVAGCEGDVPSTLALLWARFLLDQPGWMANPASVDPTAGTIDLAHCTIAPSMVKSVAVSTHFESGLGVGIHGRFGSGPVTLIRIGGADLDQLWLADATIEKSTTSGDRCRTQATVRVAPGRVQQLLERPLGNHLVLVLGHHEARLRRWWRLAIAA